MTTKPTELEESTELQNLAHADHGATAPAPEGAEPDTTDVAEFDLTDPNARAHTHERMAELRAKGPVAQVRFKRGGEDEDSEAQRQREAFFGDTVYVVTRYDEGTTALLDERFSVDPRRAMTPEQIAQLEQASPANTDFRALSRNLLSVDPPDHTRLRKLVQPSFTGGAMKALKPRIREIANGLLDDAERAAAERGESAPDRTMDLVQAFAYPLPVTVISDMLGIPAEDRSRVRGWTENLLRIDRGDGATEDAQRRLREFINYLKELFERRRHEPTDDLITQLVRAEEDGDKLDEDELMSMVFIVYIAGFVTTVNLIGNATVALLTHPEQRARFAADPSRVGSVVEETLRYWGPADSILPRTAVEDVEIGGMIVPAGAKMMVSLASADRDPARFSHPDVFDIERTDVNRHMAFGKGVHVCLGAPLARLEGQIALELLFGRFPDLRLGIAADELQWRSDFLRGFERIPLKF